MSPYRSAGMLQPAHGTKGHTLVIRIPGNPGAPPIIEPEPHLWTCLHCYQHTHNPQQLLQTWCPDTHRALTR